MARNLALQLLRGVQANKPVLNDGEFFFATDTGNLFVGLGGGTLQVEANMAINIADPTTGTNVAAVQGKGIQGAFMLCVQDAKDTGRTKVVLTLTKAAGITTEALVTLTIKKGDATTTTGTSYTVTTGKTLRIQAMQLYVANITSAVSPVGVAARLREGAAAGGVVSATSDIIAELETGCPVATATLAAPGYPAEVCFPDGVEITGGQQLGLSQLATTVDSSVTVVVTGYEY